MSLHALQPAPPAPAFRPFAVEVTAVVRLSPHFRRITFGGPDLDQLASAGADQRIKLLLPLSGAGRPTLPDVPDWYAAWRALPTQHRCPMRTYTVRAARPLSREIDVDVVLHGATGPASAWAERAEVGHELVLVGPNARFAGAPGGVEWRPPADARALLLAGDETAVPAISAIAEALPPGSGARLVLEVPSADDVLELHVPADVQQTWLPRREDGREQPRGALVSQAVRTAASDLVERDATSGAYAWLAGEAGVVTQLRRLLLREAGLDRRSVAFMGYWRLGRGEPN